MFNEDAVQKTLNEINEIASDINLTLVMIVNIKEAIAKGEDTDRTLAEEDALIAQLKQRVMSIPSKFSKVSAAATRALKASQLGSDIARTMSNDELVAKIVNEKSSGQSAPKKRS